MKSPETKSTKKTYQTPRLQVHGDIRQLTQSHSAMAMLDGGTVFGMRRTH